MANESKWNCPLGIEIKGSYKPKFESILTGEALDFMADLHRTINARRIMLLESRQKRQKQIDAGVLPDFLEETKYIRDDPNWSAGTPPNDLLKRWVEITGPVERKMMINALNSGADIFMADLEDSNSPTWNNIIEGQINLRDAVNKTIEFENPDGKEYKLNKNTATLLVRPFERRD